MTDYRVTRRRFLGTAAAAAAMPTILSRRSFAAGTGELVFGLSAYPTSLAAWAGAGTGGAIINLAINRGLLGYSSDGSLRGELAERYELENPTTWVFSLRDAVFHDGSPVTSSDVAYSIEKVVAPDSTAWLQAELSNIDHVETPDEKTVRIVTKAPIASIPGWFASAEMPIMRKDSVTEDNPMGVGAGPFVFVDQESGVYILTRAFESYYRPNEPRLAGIRFEAYQDDSLRVAALEAGNVDLIDYVPWQSMTAIENNPDLALDNSEGGQFMYVFFNGRFEPFNDPRVRLAVALGIRREEIVDAAFYGRGSALTGMPTSPSSPYYNADTANAWAYDPDRARQLLSAAGYENGFSCQLLSTSQFAMHRDTAQVIQQHLGEIGIAVELVLPDWATRSTMGIEGQYDMAVNGSIYRYNDPDAISQFIDPALPPALQRSLNLTLPGISELLAEGRSKFDVAERKVIYDELERQFLEQVPLATLSWRVQGYGHKASVGGFRNLPGPLTYFSAATLAETYFS